MRLFFSYKGIFFFLYWKRRKTTCCVYSVVVVQIWQRLFFIFNLWRSRFFLSRIIFKRKSIPNLNTKNKKRGSHQVIQLWHAPIRVDWIPWSVLIAGRQFTGRRLFFYFSLSCLNKHLNIERRSLKVNFIYSLKFCTK